MLICTVVDILSMFMSNEHKAFNGLFGGNINDKQFNTNSILLYLLNDILKYNTLLSNAYNNIYLKVVTVKPPSQLC